MGVPRNPLAFPAVGEEENEHGVRFTFYERGMTLRDWFAGQAMAGMLSDPECQPSGSTLPWNGLAKQSYAVADAMLAAREPLALAVPDPVNPNSTHKCPVCGSADWSDCHCILF